MAHNKTDTHHIVPVSIGGSNVEDNRIVVPKEQHAMYHRLFNNYHPSSILRFVLQEVFLWCFQIQIDFKKEPYYSFLKDFDDKMFRLWGSPSLQSRQYEYYEEIKSILEFGSKKKKQKIDAFKLILYQFCIYHHTSNWSPSGLLKQLFYWFKLKPIEYQDVLTEIYKVEKNKGY